jgi:hypothetical protein
MKMKKGFLKFTVMLVLAAIISLPGMASADYIQNWYENGVYNGTQQTWNTAEAFILTPGITWAGTGLSITSPTGWTTTIVNPQYALATSATAFVSSTSNWFYFTTDTTGPFQFDWVLSNTTTGSIVGVYDLTYTPGVGWTGVETLPTNYDAQSSGENRSPVPLPPSLLLLGSCLVGLCLLRGRKLSDS